MSVPFLPSLIHISIESDPIDPSLKVLWIQMRGRRLKAAGFAIGTKVRVRVRPGRLVLTAVDE